MGQVGSVKTEGSTQTQVVVEGPEGWAFVGTVAVSEETGEDWDRNYEVVENGRFEQELQEVVNFGDIGVAQRVMLS